MAFLTIKQAMTELGYRSPQSILNLCAAGQLRIVRLPLRPGAKRAKGTPRVPGEDVERIKRQSLAEAAAGDAAGGDRPAAAVADPVEAKVVSRPRRRPPPKRPNKLIHFE